MNAGRHVESPSHNHHKAANKWQLLPTANITYTTHEVKRSPHLFNHTSVSIFGKSDLVCSSEVSVGDALKKVASLNLEIN